MDSFESLGLDALDFIILAIIAVGSFLFTKFVFSKYIVFAKKKGWTGNDIHKRARPEVAESGGIAFLVGIIPAGIIILLLYPQIMNETIVFLFTVLFSGIVGFIDDKLVLSPFKKIILTAITGGPIFLLNYFDFIHINSPIIPLLGQTQLNVIYPLAIPVIIAVMTNAVNMLEGYNGEGSGTSLISIIFLIICSIIAGSSQGLIFSLVIIGALAAFFSYNKYPAKVFPGDVGTLALGAAIACVGIFGSMEVAMFCTILVHVFNGFYVVASMRGFKERHTIKTKDIIVTEDDYIEPSKGKNDHLTLPRLIVAEKPMKEPELVHNFLALSLIGGLFSVVAITLTKSDFSLVDPMAVGIALAIALVIYIPITLKFKAIRGISLFMIVLLVVGALYLYVIDVYIVPNPLNWLIAGIFGLLGFAVWYYASIRYFWYKVSKVEKKN